MHPNGSERTASAERLSELARKIAELSDENRAAYDTRRERELLSLRHESFLTLERGSGAAASTPVALAPPVPLDPSVGLPTTRGVPDAAVLRSTIDAHGSLLVREFLKPEAVATLRAAVETAVTARRSVTAGSASGDLGAWYAEFSPLKGLDARAFTESCGVLAVDSPRGVFQLIDIFREAGVDRLAADFLGSTPVLSAEKSVFRRVEPQLFASWHQDGAFLGENIRTLDVWIALSHCGKTAPSLEILPRRVPRVLPTGAFFSWDLDEKEIAKAYPGFTTVLAEFAPGDAILFDQLCVHRSGHAAGMTEPRLAIECWLFAADSLPDDYTGLVI